MWFVLNDVSGKSRGRPSTRKRGSMSVCARKRERNAEKECMLERERERERRS
jgi:hypothetical protein